MDINTSPINGLQSERLGWREANLLGTSTCAATPRIASTPQREAAILPWKVSSLAQNAVHRGNMIVLNLAISEG